MKFSPRTTTDPLKNSGGDLGVLGALAAKFFFGLPMLLLSCSNLSRAFDRDFLFENVGFELHAGERVGRSHRDDGDLATVRLHQLERELEAELVAGIERSVAGVADEQVVGPERGGSGWVGDELGEHGHVHAADATEPVREPGIGTMTLGRFRGAGRDRLQCRL